MPDIRLRIAPQKVQPANHGAMGMGRLCLANFHPDVGWVWFVSLKEGPQRILNSDKGGWWTQIATKAFPNVSRGVCEHSSSAALHPVGVNTDSDGICAWHIDGVTKPASSMKAKPTSGLAATAASTSSAERWSTGFNCAGDSGAVDEATITATRRPRYFMLNTIHLPRKSAKLKKAIVSCLLSTQV